VEQSKKYRITNIFRKDENKRYPIDEYYVCELGVNLGTGPNTIGYIPNNPNGDVIIVRRINLSDCYQGRDTEKVQDIFNGNYYSEDNNGYSIKKHGDIIACNLKPISILLTEEEIKRGYITLERMYELYSYVTSPEFSLYDDQTLHM